MALGTGVTNPTHRLARRGVSTGTVTMRRRRRPWIRAKRTIISR